MWSKAFWADLAERSIRAAVWALLGTFGASATGTLTGVDWPGALNAAGFALVFAALAALVGAKTGAKDSASFLPAKLDPPKRKAKK
jgi:hypothetical protein